MQHLESLVSLQPLRMRRVARWNECDPAGVVHATRYGDYCFAIIDALLKQLSEDSSRPQRGAHVRGRSLSLTFLRSLRPDDAFEMIAHVADVGERSFSVSIRGTTSGGTPCFEAMVVITWSEDGHSAPLPPAIRQRLDPWRLPS